MNLNFPSSNFLQFIYTIIIGSGKEKKLQEMTLTWKLMCQKTINFMEDRKMVNESLKEMTLTWKLLCRDKKKTRYLEEMKNVHHVICSGSRVILFFHFQASN